MLGLSRGRGKNRTQREAYRLGGGRLATVTLCILRYLSIRAVSKFCAGQSGISSNQPCSRPYERKTNGQTDTEPNTQFHKFVPRVIQLDIRVQPTNGPRRRRAWGPGKTTILTRGAKDLSSPELIITDLRRTTHETLRANDTPNQQLIRASMGQVQPHVPVPHRSGI